MPSTTIASFSEPEEYEGALRASFDVNLLVTRAGAFRAHLTRISLGHMTVIAGQESLPRIGFVSVPPGHILIALPVARQTGPIWQGVEVTSDRLISLGAAHGVHVRTDQGCAWAKILSTQASMAEHMRTLTGAATRLPPDLRVWHPAQKDLAAAAALHAAAVKLVRRNPDLSQEPDAVHGLEQQLTALLIQCLSTKPSEAQPAMQGAADVMEGFERLVGDQSDHPMAITDICRTLSVSERLLRELCNLQLGMEPRQYVRLRWLQSIGWDRGTAG